MTQQQYKPDPKQWKEGLAQDQGLCIVPYGEVTRARARSGCAA